MTQYACWNCTAEYYTDENHQQPGELCPTCTAAREATVREWEQSVKDTTEETRIA